MIERPVQPTDPRHALLALAALGGATLALLPGAWPALAQAPEAYESWPVLPPAFPSTGGGGIVIGEYRPVVTGAVCATPFTATEPNGTVHRNVVEFEAVPVAGGILCRNGRWRSADGAASGTTPLRVFIKDGVVRGSP